MNAAENVTEIQALLADEYTKYSQKTGRWRPSLNQYARYLGVKPSSLDNWLNGNRVPDLSNALILADKLGNRVFEILGYPQVARINDARCKFIVDTWEVLDDATIEQILAIARGEGRGTS